MKSTGITRAIDELGRIVLPKELRSTLDLNCKVGNKKGDSLEIYTEGDMLILKKYQPACVFCGEAKNVINYKGKNICNSCLGELRNK